ncbi:MAG: tetratricopeptide repeat protein [Candidatus Krumholzibacteriota bacterium]|nr:tetratricopeptide repeat protein [Candidatus Krumholzibacteriota bacterium]
MKKAISALVFLLLAVFIISCSSVGDLSADPQFKDRRGFDKDLSDAEGEYQSAKQFMEAENYYDAVVHLRKAVKLDPDYAEAWAMLGDGLAKVKKHEEAIEAFKNALELNPEDESLIASLGYNYLSSNNLDKAEEYYNMLIEKDFYDYNGNVYLAFIAKQRNQIDSAITHYKRALKTKPGDAVTLGSIASLYGDKGDKDKEIEYMQKAVEVDSTNYTMLQKLAGAYFSAQKYEKAVPVYNALLEVYPDNASFHQRLGFSISQAGGNYKEATAELEKANLLSGGNPFNYALLAKIYNDNKKYDEAVAAARMGLKIGGGKEAFLRYQLGEALSKKVMYEEAITQFQKVVSLGVKPWSNSAKEQIERQEMLIKRLEAQKEQEKYE